MYRTPTYTHLVYMAVLNAMIQDLFGFPTEDVWNTSEPSPPIHIKVIVGQHHQDGIHIWGCWVSKRLFTVTRYHLSCSGHPTYRILRVPLLRSYSNRVHYKWQQHHLMNPYISPQTSIFPYFLPLQGTAIYTQLPSIYRRNNYARPQIIITRGFYGIRNLNFILWKTAIPTSISSIYELLIHLPCHSTHNTSDIHNLLHTNDVTSLGSPCQHIYTSVLNPISAGNYLYRPRYIKFYITFPAFNYHNTKCDSFTSPKTKQQLHNDIFSLSMTALPQHYTIQVLWIKLFLNFHSSIDYRHSKWKENFIDENEISLETKCLSLHIV
jgi:hypothetical protein